MYTTALIWLLLTPLFLSLVIFTLRGTEIGGKWLVEALHVLSISIVLVLTAVVIQGVLVDGEVFAWRDMGLALAATDFAALSRRSDAPALWCACGSWHLPSDSATDGDI